MFPGRLDSSESDMHALFVSNCDLVASRFLRGKKERLTSPAVISPA